VILQVPEEGKGAGSRGCLLALHSMIGASVRRARVPSTLKKDAAYSSETLFLFTRLAAFLTDFNQIRSEYESRISFYTENGGSIFLRNAFSIRLASILI
jgi:hypothetical protein